MQPGETQDKHDLLRDITALLATAYQRRARIRLISPVAGALQSTEKLDNTAEPSPHELTLTRQRKDSSRE